MILLILPSSLTLTPTETVFVEASMATLVTVIFNILVKKINKKNALKFLLSSLFLLCLPYQYIYQFILKEPQEQSLTIFILILCSNLLSDFIEASLISNLTYFEKLMMCGASILCFAGFIAFNYNLVVTSDYYITLIGLSIFLIFASLSIKRYKAFIPL